MVHVERLKSEEDNPQLHDRIKEWLNTRGEEIRGSADVRLDAWFKLRICPELCVSKTEDWMSYSVLRYHATTSMLLFYTETLMHVDKSSQKPDSLRESGRR
jgi:hypothetical protein